MLKVHDRGRNVEVTTKHSCMAVVHVNFKKHRQANDIRLPVVNYTGSVTQCFVDSYVPGKQAKMGFVSNLKFKNAGEEN